MATARFLRITEAHLLQTQWHNVEDRPHRRADRRVRTCGAWAHTGKRIQIIPDSRPRDHIPVVMVANDALTVKQPKDFKWWGQHKIAHAFKTAADETFVVQEVEQQFALHGAR
jgi:hypothetical protein